MLQNKYVRVMDGLKSNAGGFDYKIDELNVANIWDTTTLDPEKMGGFNFGTEDKILRWLHRGDTIYDVIVPIDAELVEVDKEKGIYRSNKIIVTNPRMITDEMIIELSKKSTLNNKYLAQSFQVLLWRNHLDVCLEIIKDKVNKDNVDEIFNEYVNYASNGDSNYDFTKGDTGIIYDALSEIKSDLLISLVVDKDPYIKKLTNDRVINITGESGSGKSYYSKKYLDDDNYIVIDTDIVFGDRESSNKESLEIRELFKNKPSNSFITDFDNCYKETLDYFKSSDKTLVIDSAQYRNVKDYSILKGEVIVIRTSIKTCYERVLDRWKSINKDYNEDDCKKYANRKLGMFKWYKGLNSFLEVLDKK